MITDNKDFFISYNYRDAAWAEWIAWELEANGYSTSIQAWDFGAGSNFVLEMDLALRQAERVIAVLSPNYFDSDFTFSEWSYAFIRDPKGRHRKLIPVRVEEVDVDGLLGPIVYIDLVGKDEKTAKAKLLDGLKEQRGKPARKPFFPAGKPTPFPGKVGILGNEKNVTFEFVLSGTLTEENKSRVEAVAKHLQGLLNDPSVTLIEVKSGSIVLTLQCSQIGYARLKVLRERGFLNVIGGFFVKDVRSVTGDSSTLENLERRELFDFVFEDPVEEALSFDKIKPEIMAKSVELLLGEGWEFLQRQSPTKTDELIQLKIGNEEIRQDVPRPEREIVAAKITGARTKLSRLQTEELKQFNMRLEILYIKKRYLLQLAERAATLRDKAETQGNIEDLAKEIDEVKEKIWGCLQATGRFEVVPVETNGR